MSQRQIASIPLSFAFALFACTGRDAPTTVPASDAATTPDAPATPSPGPTAEVVITELMYHPFSENAAEDFHEFVEIHNRGKADVRLAGWKLQGGVSFTFPDSAVLKPGEYRVIAKSRTKLAQVKNYSLDIATLLGDYTGELDNGKRGRVVLQDATGAAIDTVAYSTEFPWPMGADALGLSERMLPPALLPAMSHQHMGRSLERISVDAPSAAVENWEASPVDGATPGRPNSVAGTPRAVVIEIGAAAPGGAAGALIKPTDKVLVRGKFSDGAATVEPAVEYFVDDVARTGEKTASVPLKLTAVGFEAELPSQAANAIVRYRIIGKAGTLVSPRPTDPNPWHAYFVNPDIPGSGRTYHVFIAPTNWGALYTNCQPGWVTGCGIGMNPTCKECAVNDKWDASVPAVFVHDGKVFDVHARYQGGKFARLSGRKLLRWPHPAPEGGPSVTPALGWKIYFPRHQKLDGLKQIRLNKRQQACTGIPDTVVSRLMEAIGMPTMRMRYTRLFINGGYYLYSLEQEDVDEAALERAFPMQPIGDLFNDNALRSDQGPWGWGDFRPLAPFCGYTEQQRYEYTYERQTLTWKDNSDQIDLLTSLHAARAGSAADLRKFLDDRFDRPLFLKYLAVMNWAGSWDDDYHNYMLYRRANGKWIVIGTDFNLLLTGFRWMWTDKAALVGKVIYGDATRSFYLGQQGDPDNNQDRWNYIKDSFLRVFKTEYDETLKALAPKVFDPAVVEKLIDEAAASFDNAEAIRSLSYDDAAACDDKNAGLTSVLAVKSFVRERYKVLVQRLGL